MKPIVRYMLLCNDWATDPDHDRRINVYGLLSNIRSLDVPPYPLLYRDFCVLLVLSECRGQGTIQIRCVQEETGIQIFATQKHAVSFGSDPLDVIGIPIRIRTCLFPAAGLYSAQLWYNDEMLEERPLRAR
jgi:hypothetical protein